MLTYKLSWISERCVYKIRNRSPSYIYFFFQCYHTNCTNFYFSLAIDIYTFQFKYAIDCKIPEIILQFLFLKIAIQCILCGISFCFNKLILLQFGEPSESTDTVMSEEQADLMQIQPITLNPPVDILSDSRKSDNEDEK